MTTVMVVDDAEDLVVLCRQVLQLHGYDVVAASDGRDALNRLEVTPVDLVLLDVQMPNVDGWEALRRIRSTPRIAELPVVMCTVKAHPRDQQMGWELGCDGYVAKPYAFDDLVGAVSAALTATPEERVARRAVALAELSANAGR